jgi:histidyl-tRNA synthetase
MNNVQLDMVLGYLNEGTEIDENKYIIESLNEEINRFEFVNEEGFTLCGGGRYDNLIKEIDGKQDIPAVGFGIGIERIIYFLEKEGVELTPPAPIELYVGILGASAKLEAYKIVTKLRNAGIIVETDYMDRSVKAQMKYANKIGAKNTIIIGENEITEGKAFIKNMETHEQTEVLLAEIESYFV